MDDLKIDGTQSTPAIFSNREARTLVMSGESYPDNSFTFFLPVMQWIKEYLAAGEQMLALQLHLLYLNTSSVKAMMDVFDMLEEAHGTGRSVSVTWYYNRQNERVAELGEEFKEDCSFPFDIVLRAE